MTLSRRALLRAAAALALGPAGIRSLPARLRGTYGAGAYGSGKYGGKR